MLVALAAIASGSPVASGPSAVNQEHSAVDMDTSEFFLNPFMPNAFGPSFGYGYGYPPLNAYGGFGAFPPAIPHHPFLYRK